MATILLRAPLVIVFVVSSVAAAHAGTFQDDFAAGIDPAFWTTVQSLPGLYSVEGSGGAVQFVKIGTTPGGLQYVGLRLDLNALGGALSGDFSVMTPAPRWPSRRSTAITRTSSS